MFLSKLISQRDDDRGSGLVAVISLAAVMGVIGVTVGAVTVHELQTTNGVAGSVEARAAAQAGLAQAEMLLRTRDDDGNNDCPASAIITSTTEPAFEVAIYSEDFTTADPNDWTDDDPSVVGDTDDPTCPSAESTRVKLVANGFANRGVEGAQGGEVVLEAIYQFIPEYTELEVIDPAVYAYQIEGTLKNFELGLEPDTVIASDIQIRNGNFVCTNGASVAGSVILGAGHADLTNCRVSGNLYVSDYVRASAVDSVITGNVIAAGAALDSDSRAVTLRARASVGGDVFAGGSVELDGSGETRVAGNVTAARNSSTTVKLANSTRVAGNVLTTGTISGGAATIAGTRSPGVASLVPPPSPLIPEWVNLPFASDQASIEASTWWERGFQNVVTWSGSCSLTNEDPRWAALQSYTARTIIDATACTGGVMTDSNLKPTVLLQTDIAFFADSFSFTKLYAQAANATDARRMYFVVPDNNPDAQPTCEGEAGDIYYNNEDTINAPLALFFYTPCKVVSDRNEMRGQIYGGSVEFRQQAQWTFVPASPPGVDLTGGGEPEEVLSGSFMGERLSLRELSSLG